MMWNSRTFGQRRLRGANIKPAIELSGIASNNFAAKFFGKENTERGFAGGCWPNNRQQRWITGKSCHRNSMCQPRMMRMTSATAASSRLARTCWRTIFTAFSRMIIKTKEALPVVRSFDGQIVQKNKTQTNFRAGKCRRQMVERIRGANRGNRRAIEWFFSRAEQTLRIFIGNAAVAANAEFQDYSSALA